MSDTIVPLTIACDKCTQSVIEREGMYIDVVGKKQTLFFCRSCLRSAMGTLSMKKHKQVDEIQLLANIRKFLGEVKH